MTEDWRRWSREALDAAYNNRRAVPESEALRASRAERSASLRPKLDAVWDLAYGDGPRHRLDYIRCGRRNAPVLVYIHGGYWQTNDKEPHVFLAEGPLAHGFDVALVEYTLAPAARMTAIVAEVHAAVRWLHGKLPALGGDQGRLVTAGSSAGGHLVATTMGLAEVAGGLAISGLYDLEPIRHCYLNEALGMDEAEAAAHSPIRHLPAKSGPLILTVGLAELPELIRQTRDYRAAWAAAGLPGSLIELEGENHFSILEQLAAPEGALMRALAEMVGRL